MSFLRARSILSALLLLSLALPAYTCAGYRAPDGAVVNAIPRGADSASYVPVDIPHRPLEQFDATEARSWATLLAYLWPLLLLAATRWRPKFAAHWTSSLLAFALPIASAFWIYTAVVIGTVAYGAVVSYLVISALWLLAVAELRARRRIREQRAHGA